MVGEYFANGGVVGTRAVGHRIGQIIGILTERRQVGTKIKVRQFVKYSGVIAKASVGEVTKQVVVLCAARLPTVRTHLG